MGGVALDLYAADHHRIESLSLAVRSLAQARAFLQPQGLLQHDTAQSLPLCTNATGGLVIHLVEAEPAALRN